MEKVSNPNQRLEDVLRIKQYKQTDIINMAQPYCEKYKVKLSKNDISQYLAGRSEPSQWKLFILAITLNVNLLWLMGLDVPMETDYQKLKEAYNKNNKIISIYKTNDNEKKLLSKDDDYETYKKLINNTDGKKLLDLIKKFDSSDLKELNRYIDFRWNKN